MTCQVINIVRFCQFEMKRNMLVEKKGVNTFSSLKRRSGAYTRGEVTAYCQFSHEITINIVNTEGALLHTCSFTSIKSK